MWRPASMKIDARNYEQMKARFAHLVPKTIAPEGCYQPNRNLPLICTASTQKLAAQK